MFSFCNLFLAAVTSSLSQSIDPSVSHPCVRRRLRFFSSSVAGDVEDCGVAGDVSDSVANAVAAALAAAAHAIPALVAAIAAPSAAAAAACHASISDG